MDGEFEAYAERIAYRGAAAPTIHALEGICLAHAMRIPFENLDIHRGLPIDLARPALFAKLVSRRRGGYCFEQNALLQEMLRDIGFKVRPLAARVLGSGTEKVSRPRTHMILVVEIGVRAFLADVGFGVHNLLGPLPFEPDAPRTVHGERFRLREISWDGRATGAPPAFDLEVEVSGTWKSLYRISLEHQEPPDIVMANWYASTHPDSGFVRRKLVSRPEVGVRYIMRDRELETVRGAESERKTFPDAPAYETALREIFGIDLGEGPPLRW